MTDDQNPPTTGADDGLSQDYSKGLGKWLASKPDAKQKVREVFKQQLSMSMFASKADYDEAMLKAREQ